MLSFKERLLVISGSLDFSPSKPLTNKGNSLSAVPDLKPSLLDFLVDALDE